VFLANNWPASWKVASRKMMGRGVLAGFPLLDVKVNLFDVHSMRWIHLQMAFEIAAMGAFPSNQFRKRVHINLNLS